MNTAIRSSLWAAGMGAGVMFLLDPARGGRRRALIRDKFVRAAHKSREAVEATRRDVANRMHGLGAQTRRALSRETIDDAKLIERVRARLGRVASHPRAISLNAVDSVITLTGDAFADEVSGIVRAVERVRGVERVDCRIHAYPRGTKVPSLQGSSDRSERWWTWMRTGWSPTAILLTAAGTTAAVAAVAASSATSRTATRRTASLSGSRR